MQESPAMQCVLRVFNGPMRGCEFALTQRRTLFVVGAEADFCDNDQPLTVPGEAIYVPLELGGCNFEVLLGDANEDECIIRVLGDDGVLERALPFQVLDAVGGLQVAIRPLDSAWKEELLVPAPSVPLGKSPIRVPGTWLQRGVIGCLILLIVALSVFALCTMRSGPVSSMEALIAGASSSMKVLNGSDRAVYVFAGSEREAGWARQVLVRNGYAATQVLTVGGESERLEGVLVSLVPQLAYHRLDLSDPAVPVLIISGQRTILTPELQVRLQGALRAAAPYIREVKVIARDDNMLSGAAEQGLRLLALPFTRYEHVGGVTFTIEGSLDDGELQALGEFVAGFDRQWGERYVHFAIELKDDWLKGKSFQYGPQGYIKMTPSSWYFPKPIF